MELQEFDASQLLYQSRAARVQSPQQSPQQHRIMNNGRPFASDGKSTPSLGKFPGKNFSIGGNNAFSVPTTATDFAFFQSPIVVPQRTTSCPRTAPLVATLPAKRKSRTPWTTYDDNNLMKVLGKHGVEDHFPPHCKWTVIAKELNSGRNGKQCRDRWQNYLRPGIKKGEWTRDEEELIKDMHRTFGPKWCAMAKLFKNRSDNDIKNKWYSMSRKQKRISEQLLNEFAPVAASRADVSVAKTPNEFAPMAASRADVYVAKTFNKFAPMAASRDEVSVAKTLNGFASMAASRDDVSVAKTPSSSSDSEPSPLQTWSGTPMPPIPVKSGSTPDIGTGQNFASV